MRWHRIALICALALAVAPGTWLRGYDARGDMSTFTITPLGATTPKGWPDGITLEGAWELDAEPGRFGGFSALLAMDDGAFLAFTDRGDRLHFALPGGPRTPTELTALQTMPLVSQIRDVESATRDPATGTLWLGYEYANAIRRIDRRGRSRLIQPEAMAEWGENSGPEAMVRLGDGRFIVLAEKNGTGLLFDGDPLEGDAPLTFPVAHPSGLSITDMAALPDGRVLVLLRGLAAALPPFVTMLAIADPREISSDAPWSLDPLLTIEGGELRENYEGIAITRRQDGQLAIWMISDDNVSVLQRTLLLELAWDGGQ